VYEQGKAQRALQNFFREQTLVALRELALRQTAHEVEHRMGDGDNRASSSKEAFPGSGKHHKILALVTADPKTAMVIRRAKRVSDFLGAECFAVAVQATGDLSGLPAGERQAVEQHLNFARNLHIETRVLEGEDIAITLVEFARRNQITQIFLTRPPRKTWLPVLSRDPAQRVLHLAKDMLIVIVSDREPVRHSS
jgi:two-component system sensor histidine kinase KdpD